MKKSDENARRQSLVSKYEEYLDSIPDPDKEIITITIENGKSFTVDYQRDNEPKKNWKDCNTKECMTINAAADVLKEGTEATTIFGNIIGNVREFENLLGIKILRI